jgi:hypothetical protein
MSYVVDVPKLSPEAVDILLVCCELGQWHVCSNTIIPIAQLLSQGFVNAVDDYDAIGIFITDTGRDYAIRCSWLQSDPDPAAYAQPWSRTDAGRQASNFITQRP